MQMAGAWLHYDMTTLSALFTLCELNPSVTGEFPAPRPSIAKLWNVKLLSKQLGRRCLETLCLSSDVTVRCYLQWNEIGKDTLQFWDIAVLFSQMLTINS